MTNLDDLFDSALTIDNITNIENVDSSTNITKLYEDDDQDMFETNQILNIRTMNPGKKVLTFGFNQISDNHLMDYIDNLNP